MARRKITMGDWLRGAGASLRNGTAGNPIATNRFVNAAHDQRVARESRYPTAKGNDYYSKFDSKYGRMGYFVDKQGNPTTSRPHVHVVADESQGKFFVTATLADGRHPDSISLPISASGNEVNAAVARMQTLL